MVPWYTDCFVVVCLCSRLMLEEVVNAVRSQNPMMICPFLLQTVENTALYIILYLFIYMKKVVPYKITCKHCVTEWYFEFDSFYLFSLRINKFMFCHILFIGWTKRTRTRSWRYNKEFKKSKFCHRNIMRICNCRNASMECFSSDSRINH